MEVNGENYTRNYLKHDQLQNGGTLKFKMSEKPNTDRGIQSEDFPYSFSTDKNR